MIFTGLPLILIFDEPTAVLTPQEIHELIQIMKKLVQEGKSIVLITHKLKEIMEVCDRCTIIRKGKGIGTVDVANTDENKLAELMVGLVQVARRIWNLSVNREVRSERN